MNARALLDRIGGIGVPAGMAPSMAKHLRFCNVASAAALVLAVGFAFAESPLIVDLGISGPREWTILVLRHLASLPFALPLWLSARGRFATARRALIGWGILFCVGQTLLYGPTAPSHVLFLAVAFAAAAIHPEHERRAMWTGIAGAAVGLVLCLWLRHQDVPLVPVMRPEIRVVNDVAVTLGAFAFCVIAAMTLRGTTHAAERRVIEEQERAERLLLNILPEPIAARLKEHEGSIADAFDAVTVMFVDLVGFTPLAAKLEPRELVSLMDRIFSEFDRVAEKYGLEKIKTIGDAYMVAGGLPVPSEDHAEAVADMALELIPIIRSTVSPIGNDLDVRVGVACGAVVAGVIGRRKFSYDLWGDTVNTASRLESHGEPGRIQVNEAVYERLRGDFEFEARGEIQLKGKGAMPTWYLIGRKTRTPRS
ncbi:MAG: adenylate/guanylate cyclase domain-containing protein [Planctomycetota bacterium]